MRIGPLTVPPASYLLRLTTTSSPPAEERSSIATRIVSDNFPGALPEDAPGGAISASTDGDNSNTAVGSFRQGLMTVGLPSDATETGWRPTSSPAGYR